MRKYLLFTRLSFQKLFEYRLNLLWQLTGNIVSTLIVYGFWTAILSSGFGSGLYTGLTIATYYFLVAIINSYTKFEFRPVADPIFEGDLAIDLVKPYSFIKKIFFNALPERLVAFIIGLFIYLLLLNIKLISPIGLHQLFQFLLVLNLSMLMKFYIDSLLGSLAFWFRRVHGFYYMFYIVGGLFSGQLVPVDLLPSLMKTISNYSPFQSLLYFPIQVFLNKLDSTAILSGIFKQCFWILVFFLLLKILWKKGLSSFEATGR